MAISVDSSSFAATPRKLASLRVSEEFAQFAIKAGLVVENFGIVGADLAERLQRQMEFYTSQIGAFA